MLPPGHTRFYTTLTDATPSLLQSSQAAFPRSGHFPPLPTVNDGLHEPSAALREKLVEEAWIAPEILLERVHTWPSRSLPPQGRRTSSERPVHEPERNR